MTNGFIDIHCHPSLKPYGKSFSLAPAGQQNSDRKKKNSLWYYDPPNIFERALQLLTGIAKFTQSDCTTLTYGNVQVVVASLYPIEKGFFSNDLGNGVISDLADNFITSVGSERVNYIQGISNYFEDVEREYRFYQQLNGVTVKTEAGNCKYILVKNFHDIESYIAQHPGENTTLFIALSIEGLHVLHNNIGQAPNEAAVLANLAAIKSWPHAPFFVTFAHHFYNHFCGHARSLTNLVGNVTNQSEGMNTGFTELGKKVLSATLSRENGKRIHIDIKHMSALARKEYFQWLDTTYAGEQVPVIVSHGAANGLRSMDEPVADLKETAYKLLNADINFYDNEIVRVAASGGLFGLQLDERRIASETTLQHTKHSVFMNKIRHYRAELLWNQLQHFAELLDSHNLFAWDCIAIGSDFDGIINPLNGFLTAETMDHLQEYTERHAYNYMNTRGKEVLQSFNQVPAAEIMSRVFHTNAWTFMKKWFV